MKPSPQVSVILPFHNPPQDFLASAIQSILDQTFPNFELILIDDGSDDSSCSRLLRDFRKQDSRVRLIKNSRNLGLARSLNKGLKIARGKYVARMDADDISLPERLEKQVAFLNKNPQVILCGTRILALNDYPGRRKLNYPTNPERIKCQLLFSTPIAHPTVMMRRKKMIAHQLFYNPFFKHAQDYDLWVRVARKFPIANLKQRLLRYRINFSQFPRFKRKMQQTNVKVIYQKQLQYLGLKPTRSEIAIHLILATGALRLNPAFPRRAAAWLKKIEQANQKQNVYSQAYLTRLLAKYRHQARRQTVPLPVFLKGKFKELRKIILRSQGQQVK